MKKINYFKAGATAYMLLGLTHLFSQMSKNGLDRNVLQMFDKMKETTFDFMGQHDLMQFYTGFGIAMGFMLFAFGLQAFMIKNPTKTIIKVNILVSTIASAVAIIYFHPLAYTFLLFSLIFFTLSLIKTLRIAS